MSKITYFTRSTKKGDHEVSIWIRIHHQGSDLRISTSITIPAKYWSCRQCWVRDTPYESESVRERMQQIEHTLYDIKHRLYSILLSSSKIDRKTIKQEINSLIRKEESIKSPNNPTMSQYIYSKIMAMETKRFLNKGEPYSQNAMDNWKKFLNIWSSFEVSYSNQCIYPDDVNMQTYYSFMDFCDKNQYKKSTKYQYARLFKASLNYALIDGVSSNRVHFNRNFATHASVESGKGIYLSMQEIFNLSVLELPEGSTHAKIRDLFLIGCYTGMRFSDYSTISIDDIIHFDIDGQQHSAIMKTQQKTKQRVAIPLMNDEVEKILTRWGGRVPKVSIAAFNREIKHICRMAGIKEKVRIFEIIGNNEIQKWTTKDQLVSSHTARRSCITNLYLSGKLDSSQIRDISGHKSEHAFQRYICLSAEENVKAIFKKLVQ